jgi:hypothetical protein
MDERKPCTARVQKKAMLNSQPCGALAEPGVEHCAVHVTALEKDFLRRQRAESRPDGPPQEDR